MQGLRRTAGQRPTALWLMAAAFGGCSTDGASAASDSGIEGGHHASGLLPSPLSADFRCDPTIESMRDTIFVKTCAWDTCHSDNAPPFGLSLITDPQAIHDELVGHAAGGCKDQTLVIPGDPERSYFWNKIVAPRPTCGETMPRGVEPLPQAALTCVRDWISQL